MEEENQTEIEEKKEETKEDDSYLISLDNRKKELLEIEKRLDDKRKAINRELESIANAGRGFLIRKEEKKEETNEEYTARVLRGEI